MKMILFMSDMIIPFTMAFILIYGYYKKVPLFDTFIEGVGEGVSTVFKIMPTILGLLVAVGVLRGSGAFDLLVMAISPLAELVHFPKEVIPLTFMRLVSSSASTGLLLDIYKTYGTDSFLGRYVSIMMSCTETVFYTMSVYFLSVKITKTRYTLSGALFANIVGVIVSLFVTKWVF